MARTSITHAFRRSAVIAATLAGALVSTMLPAGAGDGGCTVEFDPDVGILDVVCPAGGDETEIFTITRHADGSISVNGGVPNDASVNNTQAINVFPGGGNDIIAFKYADGLFAPGAPDDPTEDDTPEIEISSNGGSGNDSLTIIARDVPDKVILGTSSGGLDGLNVNGDTDRDLNIGSFESVLVNTRSGDDVLDASGGQGTGNALASPVTLDGGNDDDTVRGGLANDILRGEQGNDTLSYSKSSSGVNADLRSQATGQGTDTLNGTFENVVGSPQRDVLGGTSQANTIRGKRGNDTLRGRAGNDNLRGGPGNDTCIGGRGSDTSSGCETRRGIP